MSPSPQPPRHPLHDFDDEDPSVAASLSDFESSEPRNSPTFDLPSQHSGFRSGQSAVDMDSEAESSVSAGPWSPPAWRRPGSGWFQQHDRLAAKSYQSPAHSRHSSPIHDDSRGISEDPDFTLPTRVPLPGSPEKQMSPEGSPEPTPEPAQADAGQEDMDKESNNNNYIRFSVRADVQHRTEPLDAFIRYWRAMSRSSVFLFFTSLLLAISLFNNLTRTPDTAPGPDLIKVAGLARSFEPLMHYSENGVAQIGDLEETGVAVWDLGESVRVSNMTSAPIIVAELDELSGSLKALAIELTKFFATVNGDIDSILLVMEWAKRELTQISSHSPGTLSSVIENMSSFVHQATGANGAELSTYIHSMLGMTHGQLSRAVLSRTFHEFLAVLEDSINAELSHSTHLFALFEASDRQFLNLQRSVARETSSQDAAHDAELATLWSKLLGPSTKRLKKFEKNMSLLRSVRERTVANKLTLVEHNGRLLALRANLEALRQRLVSPLVRSENASTASVREQIDGLEGCYQYLKLAREKQKGRLVESWYAYGNRGRGRTIGEESGQGYQAAAGSKQ